MTQTSSISYKSLLLSLSALLTISVMNAQVAINKDGSSPHPSAILDVSSDDSGLLMPRMTYAQRTSLAPAATAEGLLVYQTNNFASFLEGVYEYDGAAWIRLNTPETFKGRVISGFGLVDGALPGATLTSPQLGVTDFDIPGLGADAVVIVNPEFSPIGTPPTPPADYCLNAFAGNCATKFHNRWVSVSQPVGMILNAGYTPNIQMFLHHCPTAASCQVGTTDYQYHNNNGTTTNPCFPFGITDPYNGDFSFPPYVGVDLNTLAAGSQFDLAITGNQGVGGNMSMSVFIDWNQDGDFYDEVDGFSEQLIRTPNRSWPFTGVFSRPNLTSSNGNTWLRDIPPNAVNGKTTMRVMSTPFSNNNNPCVIHSVGSTRDYAFEISGGLAPSYPGELRSCNVFNQDASGFEVHCFKTKNGQAVDDSFYILINPQ